MVAYSQGATSTNLPAEVTSFVGRRRETLELKRMLTAARLVTLTGSGGVGKTRLALRVATDLRRAFGDGVWLVELDKIHDPALVVHTIATTLGVRGESGRCALAVLREALADRQVLLVLDNCEHLLAACADVADALLRTCPDLRILTASREPLGVVGETTMLVPPMSVPDPRRPPTLRAMAQYEAVNLFTARARSAVSGFELTADNYRAVAAICHQLDGLPLAIELASVRLRALSPKQVLDRLNDRFRLLSRGSRGLPDRQQTLLASIDCSYHLCTVAERTLWPRLSVFVDGFEIDAAEGICAGDGIPADEVVGLVAALVEKSIVLRDGAWYAMLSAIGEYGQARLRDCGEYPRLRRRHRDWYEALLHRADTEWISTRQVYWLVRLEREHPNLRAALDFCLSEPGEAQAALRIAVALPGVYWWARGLPGYGRHWLYPRPSVPSEYSDSLRIRIEVLDRALRVAPDLNLVRARALLLYAVLAILARDIDRAARMQRAGGDLAVHLGDPGPVAFRRDGARLRA
jgi:predicted ATPase